MGTGKFFPSGGKRDKAKEKEEEVPEPIRAEEAPEKKASGGGLFPQARSRFSKPMDSRIKPGATVISVVFCIIFISIGWYFLAVRPAQIRTAILAGELARRAKEIDDLKKKQEEELKAAEEKKAAARATVKVDTRPPHAKLVLGDVTKVSPAVFEGVMPGKTTLTVTLDGYRPVSREVTLEGDQTADLGIIELAPKVGSLKVSSPQTGVTYILTGANDFSRSGALPAVLEKLPEGEYTIIATHKGWQLAPVKLTIQDGKETAQEIKFGYGTITLASVPPGATVRAKRQELGQTPLTLSELRPGQYKYTIEKDGYRMATVQVDLKEFGTSPIAVTLEKTRDFTGACGVPMIYMPQGYWVGKYEVTQGQYELVMGRGANPSIYHGANRPVENVTWQQAMDFCAKLTQLEEAAGKLPAGYHYTLPTEAQWNDYVGDSNYESAVMALNSNFSPSATSEVGSSDPNQFGLYDVLGNVWEWCADNFDAEGRAHVMRGGGWLSTRDTFPNKGTRNGGAAAFHDKFTGFRVVLTR